jgi:hypothetical protein
MIHPSVLHHRFPKKWFDCREGKYTNMELTQTTAYNEDSKYLKDDEIL